MRFNTRQSAAGGELAGLLLLEHQGSFSFFKSCLLPRFAHAPASIVDRAKFTNTDSTQTHQQNPQQAQRSELGSVTYYSGYLDKGALSPFKKPEFKPQLSSLDGTEPPPLGLQQSFVFPRPVLAMGACVYMCVYVGAIVKCKTHPVPALATSTHNPQTHTNPPKHRRDPHGAGDHLQGPLAGVRPRPDFVAGPAPPRPSPACAAAGEEAHGGGAGGG